MLKQNTFIMKKISSILVLILLSISLLFAQENEYALVIHGGAGFFDKSDIKKETEKKYQEKMNEALEKGSSVLDTGGTAVLAVIESIKILEDSPLFNAGKGAVFTSDGHNELDASIMDGKTQNAGAVAGVRHLKNPITAAEKVMTNSPHVLLSGAGAEEFAKTQQLHMVDSSYFFTPRRWKSLQRALKKSKHGTVGCVALDKNGNLAAGTSTGGMTAKRFGRIGDSPIIGAGTFADNTTCAVSATGHGEFFIRYVVAYDIAALMNYKKWSLAKAADYVINEKLKKAGGTGGVIALDKEGNIAMPFNTSGMFRAYIKSNGEKSIQLYK